METQSLLQRSQSLKSEAQDFLNRYDIDAILGKYFKRSNESNFYLKLSEIYYTIILINFL